MAEEEDLEVAVAEIEEEEEVVEASTEAATEEDREALGAATADLVTGPAPSPSAETQTLPGGTSATSARNLKRTAWEEVEVAMGETEEEEEEDMGEAATETTEEAEVEALGETEEEEEVVMEGVMTEEEAVEEEASVATETEMIGEEVALGAEEEEEGTGGAVALEVTDAAGEVDLAGAGTGAEEGPWEEAGEAETGTGLTKH